MISGKRVMRKIMKKQKLFKFSEVMALCRHFHFHYSWIIWFHMERQTHIPTIVSMLLQQPLLSNFLSDHIKIVDKLNFVKKLGYEEGI